MQISGKSVSEFMQLHKLPFSAIIHIAQGAYPSPAFFCEMRKKADFYAKSTCSGAQVYVLCIMKKIKYICMTLTGNCIHAAEGLTLSGVRKG